MLNTMYDMRDKMETCLHRRGGERKQPCHHGLSRVPVSEVKTSRELSWKVTLMVAHINTWYISERPVFLEA